MKNAEEAVQINRWAYQLNKAQYSAKWLKDKDD